MRCKSVLFLMLVMVGLFAIPSALSGQAATEETSNWLRYDAEKKGEAESAVIEAFVPILGHAYAGEASKGYLPAAVSAGGLLLMIAGAGDLNTGVMSLGYLGYLGGRVWGIVSAYQTAERSNTALRERLNISVGPGRSAGSFGFTFNVAVR